MSENGPIRVFHSDGKWLVDYGSYAHGFHLTREAAIHAAAAAARSEHRGLLVEADA